MQPVEQRDEVEMLSLMLLIRRFEERASQQYQAQKIGGFCHLYIGQEAVVTGAVAAVRDDDYIITAYRDHAHALARGTSPDACMAELFGKETGCSRGLGGSMHFFDKQHHMYGGYDIPGEIVDGMNFREVRDKVAEIVDSTRKEPHPAFLEVRTYRYRGHSMSDPASYRTKQELEKYRLDDPITRLRAQLTREGKLTNEQFDLLDKRAKETVLAAVKFAEKSPQPPLDTLYDYTYANGAMEPG